MSVTEAQNEGTYKHRSLFLAGAPGELGGSVLRYCPEPGLCLPSQSKMAAPMPITTWPLAAPKREIRVLMRS